MKPHTERAFGDELRRHRGAAGLTQEELAERAQLSVRAVSDLERGVKARPHRDTVSLLATALGLEGSERDAFEAARGRGSRAQSAGLPAADVAPRRTPETIPHNLALQLTSFIGREREMAEVTHLLESTRLLTLTGPGGTGKTRLALQVAADLLEHYPQGVWLVEFAPLADPTLVAQALAAVLGVRDEPARPLLSTRAAVLRPKQLLLVLDNCEHLIDACATLADALLHACPHLRILATSREALGIAGETSWRVPSLALPSAQEEQTVETLARYEAVRLFLERAVAVQPHFALSQANAPAVAQICRRLDGIPLALELAAARVKGLAIEHLAARLDQRFRLLTGGSRTALPRQQTLQAAVDWSFGLLSAPEQTLFTRLAVFTGGFTLEAAEAVCGSGEIALDDVLDLLLRLVDKSLVSADDEGTRYRLLETLRQYGREKQVANGEAVAIRGRHAAHYLALAEEAEMQLRGATQRAWLDRLETEHDNLLAAARWIAEEGQTEQALRLGGALALFWVLRGRLSPGRDLLTALLAAPGAEARTEARARALWAAGLLAWSGWDLAAAQAPFDESLAIARELDDGRAIGYALLGLGILAGRHDDSAATRALLDESLGLLRAAGERWASAWVLTELGPIALADGDAAAARALHGEACRTFRDLGDGVGLAVALMGLAVVARGEGDIPAARALFEESLSLQRAVGDQPNAWWALRWLGDIAADGGEYAAARALYAAALANAHEVGDTVHSVLALGCFADLAAAEADSGRAVRLGGAAAALRERNGMSLGDRDQVEHERQVESARRALGAAAATAAWAEGQVMTLEEAIAYALDQTSPP